MPFAIPGEQIDGIDVRKVRAAARRCHRAGAGDGEGPTILEMLTYRYRGHDVASPQVRETQRSAAMRRTRCAKSRARILAERDLPSEAELKAIEKDVRDEVSRCRGRSQDRAPVARRATAMAELGE